LKYFELLFPSATSATMFV